MPSLCIKDMDGNEQTQDVAGSACVLCSKAPIRVAVLSSQLSVKMSSTDKLGVGMATTK